MDRSVIERALDALGSHLETAGVETAVVIVGGAALSLRRWVARTTEDVDVIAVWSEGKLQEPRFDAAVATAVGKVARDFGLAPDWLNVMAGMQWRSGMPPGLDVDLVWMRFKALRVGVAGRRGLLALKYFAAADQGPASVHAQDLIALDPTDDELATAADCVVTQDIAPEWPQFVKETAAHVVRHRSNRG